jgi:protein FrlC
MLPTPGGGPGFNAASPSPEECRATIEQYNKVVDLCADLGGRTVLYVAGWQVFGTSRQQAWAWSREALIEIAAHASNRGVTLAIEPTSADSNLIGSCDDAMTLMAEVDEPNVKLMFDTYHVIYRNEVSTDYIRCMGKDLHHIHLADANRSAPSDAGQADYRGIVQEFRNLEFQGYVTMEIGFDRRSVGADRIAREALEYIRPLVS